MLPTCSIPFPEVLSITRTILAFTSLVPYEPPVIERGCPLDMVQVESTCVDIYPWPGEGHEPRLGVSAIYENYVETGRETWDCESLCAWKNKRLCSAREWKSACVGTPAEKCGPLRGYIAPQWDRVATRDPRELRRLDQHARADDYPECVSFAGTRMQTTVQEWVRWKGGHVLSRGFWSRPAACDAFTTNHAGNWHDYATACRCCKDAPT